MGKKGIKQYARIASKYGTKFEGYNVPVGAIYGRVLIPYEEGTEYIFFICTQPKNIRKDTMPIYVLKPSWVSNRWREMLIGREHPAFTAVANICHEIGRIPKIKTFQDPKVAEKRAEKTIDRAYKQVSRQYGLRPVPCNGVRIKPEYDSYVTPQQARIPWDELVHDEEQVSYNNDIICPESISFRPFEGYTDTYEARRRDGMKINQIKCRPEKVEKRATIVIKINGKIID